MKRFLAVVLTVLGGAQALWAGHGGGCFGMGGGGMACGHGGGKIVLYLLALALGYWVLRTVEGDKGEKKYLRRVGLGVGWIILAVSVFGLLCVGGSAVCRRWCPDHGKKMCVGPMVPGHGQMPPGHPPVEGMSPGSEKAPK